MFAYVLASTTIACFILHAYAETFFQVSKYSFYDRDPFLGGVYANAASVMSRLFFSLGTASCGLFIEISGGGAAQIGYLMAIVMLGCSLTTWLVMGVKLDIVPLSEGFSIFRLLRALLGLHYSRTRFSHHFYIDSVFLKFASFFNVSAFVFVLLFASALPQYRMTIVALSPVVSMFGTVLFIFYFEPKISNDLSRAIISKEIALSTLLRARMVGYIVASVGCLILGVTFFESE